MEIFDSSLRRQNQLDPQHITGRIKQTSIEWYSSKIINPTDINQDLLYMRQQPHSTQLIVTKKEYIEHLSGVDFMNPNIDRMTSHSYRTNNNIRPISTQDSSNIHCRPKIITKSLGSRHHNHDVMPHYLLNVSEQTNYDGVQVLEDENTVVTSETGPFPVISLLPNHDKIQIEQKENRKQQTQIYNDRLQYSHIQRTASPVSSTYLDFGKMSVTSSTIFDSPRVGQIQPRELYLTQEQLPIQTMSTSYFSLPLQHSNDYQNIEKRRGSNLLRPVEWSVHQQRQQTHSRTSFHNDTSTELQLKSGHARHHNHHNFRNSNRSTSSHSKHGSHHNSKQYKTLEIVYPLHSRQEAINRTPDSREKFIKVKNAFPENNNNLSTSRLDTLEENDTNSLSLNDNIYYDHDSDSLYDQSVEQLESFDTLVNNENRHNYVKNTSKDPGCGGPTIDHYGRLSQSQRIKRAKSNMVDVNCYCFPDDISEKELQEKRTHEAAGASIHSKDNHEKHGTGTARTYDVHNDTYTYFNNSSVVKECIDIDNDEDEDDIHHSKSNTKSYHCSSTTEGCGIALVHNFVKYMCTDVPESLNDARCAMEPLWNNTFRIRDTDIDAVVNRIEKVKYQMDEYLSTLHF